jgi:trimeric autotransporter adhesin
MRIIKTIIVCAALFSNLLVFQNCAESIDVGAYTEQSSLAAPPPTSPPVVAPTIASQSPNPSVLVGQAFTLSVNVQGDPSTFQWYKDGVLMTGATSASHSVAVASLADNGIYTMAATNSAGTVIASFTVTVTAAPQPPAVPAAITMQPAPILSRVTINNNVGVWSPATVVLSVAASGSNLTYQWYHRGAKYGSFTPTEVALQNSNSPSWTVRAVYGDAMSTFCGVYRVVVSNSLNTVASSAVTVECSAGGNIYK